MNVDSAEYANIVISVTRFLDQGRAAGMRIPAADLARMRVWARRVIAGYWTHAGYLNWDTGFGFERWHQAKKLGLSAQALIGLASSDTLGLEPHWRAWAKDIFDRRPALLRAPVGARRRRAARAVLRRPQGAPDAGERAPRRRPHGVQRRPRDRRRARPRALEHAALALRLRPRHRPPRGHDARLQHRDHDGQPGRLPLRRARARAPLRRPSRRWPATSAACRPPRSGWSSTTSAAAACSPPSIRAGCRSARRRCG